MSSIVTAVFKATIGLLVTKGRDELAEKLKDGDVIDQQFHSLIVREIDNIKSKLDALSRKDLETSISFFEEGMLLLLEVFEIAKSRNECGAATAGAACDDSNSLIKGIGKLEPTGLDESATTKLSAAKERFKDTRKEATRAFKNEGLKISDRILAMKYRVMATILETVDDPGVAVKPCRVCLKEINCLPAVQNSFDVQLKKGIQAVRGFFSQEKRREIISSVCQVNRVIYDVTRTIGEDAHFLSWPPIDTGENKINPLYDARVSKVLLKHGMEHCCVLPWSFGQNSEKEHTLKSPMGIATNSGGEFIIGEDYNGYVKVFDSSGKFVKHFSLPTDDVNTELYIKDVATNKNDNIFVLTEMRNLAEPRGPRSWWIYKLKKTGDPYHRFRLRREGWGWYTGLSVTDTGKVLTRGMEVEEYDTNGMFVRCFSIRILRDTSDVTVVTDGRVMVMDIGDSCVHIISEHGDHLNKFKLQRNDCNYGSITFHRTGEHVVIAGARNEKELLQVEIYSKDGEFVRSVEIQIDGIVFVTGITVTTEGRIAVVVGTNVSHKVMIATDGMLLVLLLVFNFVTQLIEQSTRNTPRGTGSLDYKFN